MAGIQVQFDMRKAQAAVRALASDLNSLDKSFTAPLQGAGQLASPADNEIGYMCIWPDLFLESHL